MSFPLMWSDIWTRSASFSQLSCLAAVFLSRSARKEAERDYNDAVSFYRTARNDLIEARKGCVDKLEILAINRLACVGWQLDHIRGAASRLGVAEEFFGKKAGIFGGRTLAQVMQLIRTAKNVIIPPTGVFDTSVMLASATALIIEGAQYLDKIGVADAPILHTSLHDAIGSLPVEHAHGAADALGGLGSINVGDLLGDALIVFSAFKSLYNLARAEGLGSQASTVRGEAGRLRIASGTVRAIESKAHCLSGELDDRSYDAFKWSIIAKERQDCTSANRHGGSQGQSLRDCAERVSVSGATCSNPRRPKERCNEPEALLPFARCLCRAARPDRAASVQARGDRWGANQASPGAPPCASRDTDGRTRGSPRH